MKESYSEVLARHAGPESYAGGGNTVGVATAGVHAGPVTQRVPGSEIRIISRADVVQAAEGNITSSAKGKHEVSVAESKTWCMCGNSKRAPSQCKRAGDPIGSSAAKPRTVSEPH